MHDDQILGVSSCSSSCTGGSPCKKILLVFRQDLRPPPIPPTHPKKKAHRKTEALARLQGQLVSLTRQFLEARRHKLTLSAHMKKKKILGGLFGLKIPVFLQENIHLFSPLSSYLHPSHHMFASPVYPSAKRAAPSSFPLPLLNFFFCRALQL